MDKDEQGVELYDHAAANSQVHKQTLEWPKSPARLEHMEVLSPPDLAMQYPYLYLTCCVEKVHGYSSGSVGGFRTTLLEATLLRARESKCSSASIDIAVSLISWSIFSLNFSSSAIFSGLSPWDNNCNTWCSNSLSALAFFDEFEEGGEGEDTDDENDDDDDDDNGMKAASDWLGRRNAMKMTKIAKEPMTFRPTKLHLEFSMTV